MSETRRIADVQELQKGERGTVNGRQVYLRCEGCGALLLLGRNIWMLGTVDDVKDTGRRPCCKPQDREP